MNTDKHGYDVDDITEQIIGCAFRVSNQLGVGYLEKVYENALAYELRKVDLEVEQQAPLTVKYEGVVVGEYFVDLLVQKNVVVELKHASNIDNAHIAQCINYLKAANIRVGLILNFGQPKLQMKRLVQG